jgi:hypothetical protein
MAPFNDNALHPGELTWPQRIENYRRVIKRPAFLTIEEDWIYGAWFVQPVAEILNRGCGKPPQRWRSPYRTGRCLPAATELRRKPVEARLMLLLITQIDTTSTREVKP